MSMRSIPLAAAVSCLSLMTAFAALAEGAWTFGHEFRGHPEVKFVGAGQQKFELGCGRAIGLWIAYAGPGKIGDQAEMTLSNGKTTLTYQGEIAEGAPFETKAPYFLVWDLGAPHGDPALNPLLDALLDFMSAGAPITVSSGGASFELPAPKIENLKQAFRKDCPAY
jgi:hypothetical protein